MRTKRLWVANPKHPGGLTSVSGPTVVRLTGKGLGEVPATIAMRGLANGMKRMLLAWVVVVGGVEGGGGLEEVAQVQFSFVGK
jgi:hypothetical protein